MFPIIIYDGKSVLPDDKNIFYVIAKNGMYLYKDLKTIRSLTRVESVSILKDLDGFAELKIPSIPKEIIIQAVGFFRYVYKKCGAEAGLILCYFPESGQYELYCPTQKVSSGSVNWNNEVETIPQGSIRIGTIHSHGSGSAFHSGTDRDDEKNFDGLHITIGRIDEKVHGIVASIVVNNNRFLLEEDQVKKYIDISVIPVEGNTEKDNIYIVHRKSDISQQSMYEDYQPIIGNHNIQPITLPANTLKKWKGYALTKGEYTSSERRFMIDYNGLYIYPSEWNDKFKYTAPKVYTWSKKFGKFIETSGYGDGYDSNYYGKDYDWGKWAASNYISKNYDVPNYPLTCNPYYPKGNEEYNSPQSDGYDDADLFPMHGNCNKCIYKEVAQKAINDGSVDLENYNDDTGDYAEDIANDLDNIKIAIKYGFTSIDEVIDYLTTPDDDDIPSEDELYGKHSENLDDINQYDIHHDEKGNIVDNKGNIVVLLTKEDQNHIDSIISTKDIIDHQ